MKTNNLSIKPKDLKIVNSDIKGVESWFYETIKGFIIIVEIREINFTEYIHIKITWRMILASVKRYLSGKN